MDTEREGESSDVHRGSELEWCKPVESFRYKCLYKKGSDACSFERRRRIERNAQQERVGGTLIDLSELFDPDWTRHPLGQEPQSSCHGVSHVILDSANYFWNLELLELDEPLMMHPGTRECPKKVRTDAMNSMDQVESKKLSWHQLWRHWLFNFLFLFFLFVSVQDSHKINSHLNYTHNWSVNHIFFTSGLIPQLIQSSYNLNFYGMIRSLVC